MTTPPALPPHPAAAAPAPALRRWLRWGAVLGFALGGFFDGILLHQILQWHHLLSLVPGVASLRAQVLWDGWFHAAMYGVAIAGLVGLWRTKAGLVPQQAAGRVLAGAVLIGFGAWHAVDALLSHWLLGIHRVRLDSTQPLAWDLLWLGAFGLIPLAIGWRLLRGGSVPRQGTTPHVPPGVALLLVGTVTAALGGWALRPPPGPAFTTIVFAPGVSPAQAMNVLVDRGARIVWTDPALSVAVIDAPAARARDLYAAGALFVGGGAMPGGCLSWRST